MRKRIGAIIYRNSSLILLYRNKNGYKYYTIPGGGVDDGENEMDALHREIFEELGITIIVKQEFHRMIHELPIVGEQEEVFYLCEMSRGELGSGIGEEFTNMQKNNLYKIECVAVDDLNKINLVPEVIKEKILN